ncbi:polyphosphate polymerase domain-containing protein [Carboxylicivirga linearis]|uniref:Polyphosphate polymerase domain-containing protein n=1 Tax=Carboxylicivirga linearis TaxID=1628157 RepID=A0ABS5JX72_9BACT|nr:polyphosphate polymerase domain-containing protein [Carboxylicivirga linearis]MBS2099505.1 polyphosphate polymerase domain-containing protein [Carboxylicivirga linearis]
MKPNPNNIANQIKQVLLGFTPITLDDMNHVSLMNRIDTKFIVPISILPALLKDVQGNYQVLDINNERVFLYKTEYFDTHDFSMYEAHHNGKLNRFKIRKREYVASGKLFLEVKYKNNKRRTIKKRIEKDHHDMSSNESSFIEENSPYKMEELELKLSNQFYRITLVGSDERLTIDFDLSFAHGDDKDADFPDAAIIEFKQSKFNINSMGMQILKKHGIRPESCSKYCLGAASLHTNIKANRLKQKFELLEKFKLN